MRTSCELLTDLGRHMEEAELAKALGVSSETLRRIRHRQTCFDEAHADFIAAELGLDSFYVVSCLRAERAKRRGTKTTWERIARGSVVK